MFGQHSMSYAAADCGGAPLRSQQPGASSSGRLCLWGHRDVSRPCTQPGTCAAGVRARRRTLRVEAASGETASSAATASSTAARQKALDAVRESLRRRAASGTGQRAASGKPTSRTAAPRPRPQGGKQSSIAQPFQGSAPVTLRRPAASDPAADGQRLSKVRRRSNSLLVQHMCVSYAAPLWTQRHTTAT